MKATVPFARIMLGLIFFVFGLNGFFTFLEPPAMNQRAVELIGALMATGYMMPAVKLVEVLGGGLLLAGVYVPLALVILAPIVVNIFLLHVFLDGGWMVFAVFVLLGMYLALVWAYVDSFRGMLTARARPRV